MCQRVIALASLLIISCSFGGHTGFAAAGAGTPVFPEAEGFGTGTPAGRGGAILLVTNLNDRGPGSLRDAVSTPGARIILFEVGGTITLASHLEIIEPFVTIAGQTAPSPGITLRGGGLSVKTHDVLIQHLRIRVGDLEEGPPPSTRDSLNIIGPFASKVVVDHVSASWATDENGSTWSEVTDVTVVNSLFSEGLHRSYHDKGPHSKGFLVGDKTRNITLAGNLFAHNADRNPLIKGGSSAVVVNNLMYNAGLDKFVELVDDGAAGPISVSIVGNVFLAGDDTPAEAALCKIHKTVRPGSRVFLADNLYDGLPFRNGVSFDPRVPIPPVWDRRRSPLPAAKVADRVLSRVGARPGDRDAVDLRVVQEVRTRTGRIIDSQKEVDGWPVQEATFRPFPVPADPHGDPDGDGYSRLEELLQQMAREVEDPLFLQPSVQHQ